MRQSISWASALLVFAVGFGSVANGQEGRVDERPEASARRTQPAEPESPAATGVPALGNQAAAPHMVKVSAVLTEFVRNSASSSFEMTFAVYKDEVGGEALWTETQSVEVDKEGRYTVLLGATQGDGVPVELFPAGEPRWLGVEIRGQAPQSRTLLVSVPYALKALDAEKLGGKSLSDFVLSESLGEQVRQVIQAQGQTAGQSTLVGAQQKQTGTSSTATPQTSSPGPKFPPSTFSGTTSDQIVLVQQNGSGNGLYAQTASSTGDSGVVGVATSTSTSNAQNGVIGFNAGAGSGVAGIATNPSAGVGVYGQSSSFAGIFGQTFNANTNGVAGLANAMTGFSNGVSGFTKSAGGNGVFGQAAATSGFTNGVYGQNASTNGNGVLGVALASSGSTYGVFGDGTASPNGTGVFGSAGQWFGVGGRATATSGGPAYGVWGDSLSTGGVGVAGFEDATSGYTNGVMGTSVSPNGNGVFGVNNAATGGNGVVGISNATSGSPTGVLGQIGATNGAGVLGVATATTGFNSGVYGNTASDEGYAVHGDAVNTAGNAVGMFGTSVGTNGGIGVWGVSHATSGVGNGVRGDLEEPTASGAAGFFLTFSPTSVAGEFVNASRQGLLLQGLSGPFDATQKEVFRVDASGNLHITGNLTVDGTKSSTAKLQDGREVALYAVESPENWFEDFGSGELNSGVAWVPLDASFAQAVNSAVSYHVFLTPNGDSNGLYVARKTAAGFEIREHGGGTSNVAFDYRIVARRRGYEAIRMLQVPERKPVETFGPRVELATARPKVEPVKIPPSASVPMIHPVPPSRPVVPEVPRPIVPQAPKVNVPQAPKGSVPQPSQPQ